MGFAARFRAELATSKVVSRLVQAKTVELFEETEAASASRREFSELVFKDAYAVREAVNSGQRSLREALALSRRRSRQPQDVL
jgi:predicted HAD superfamily Cof-like phosphohydrolase